MIFLDTSETLARLGGAFPPGHRLLGLAAELAAGASRAAAGAPATAEAGTEAGTEAALALAERLFPRKGNAAAAAAEIGALGAAGGPVLLWLDPRAEGGSAPRQLVLDLPAGRYRAEYWDVAERRLAGVEIATAAPLVLGPPDPRAACAVLIVPLF